MGLTSKLEALAAAKEAVPAKDKAWYQVLRPAYVREGEALDSPKKGLIKPFQRVLVSEVHGERAKIEAPLEGWTSIRTAKHAPILAPEGEAVSSPDSVVHRSPAGKDEDWKKLSSDELHEALRKGKVDPGVVMADGFGRLSHFLSNASKELESVVGKEQPAANGAKVGDAPKQGTVPFQLPSIQEVRAQLERDSPFAKAAKPMLKDHLAAAEASHDPRDQKLLSQEALQVADKLLQNEGQKLEDATKGLTGTTKALLEKNAKEMRERMAAQARAGKEPAAE